ncbi:hypothetical protein [Hoeflea alexandrii]
MTATSETKILVNTPEIKTMHFTKRSRTGKMPGSLRASTEPAGMTTRSPLRTTATIGMYIGSSGSFGGLQQRDHAIRIGDPAALLGS